MGEGLEGELCKSEQLQQFQIMMSYVELPDATAAAAGVRRKPSWRMNANCMLLPAKIYASWFA
jgi:hypothetical protein